MRRVTACRLCSGALKRAFSLGEQYVSNFLLPGESPGERVEIAVAVCQECTLPQAECGTATLPTYWYRSGVTNTMRAALRDVAQAASLEAKLEPGDTVLDIGGNDGTLLRCYRAGIRTVNVEPAPNLAEEASRGVWRHIPTAWDAEAYLGLGMPRARAVTACGMMYDLEDPVRFVTDVARVLHPDGVFIAQLMCLEGMVRMRDVGNLAHEHLEFYTVRSLQELYRRAGLEIYRVEQNAVNGHSYRIYAGHPKNRVERSVISLADTEDAGVALRDFYARACEDRDKCVAAVRAVQPEQVWVYGASTKGNTILQWYGLDCRDIAGASERSSEKHGRRCVGSNIQIFSEEHARQTNPRAFLALPYAFIHEFCAREAEWLAKGNYFLLPNGDRVEATHAMSCSGS